MRSQLQAFRAYYGSMADAELLQIAAHRNSFIAIAQTVLADELEKRRLTPPVEPVASVRHSVLWDWGNQLARFAGLLRHHHASP